ncbi:MAG: hypothetical protein ACYTFY_22540, partial [Planctomycetota bacterium]
MEITKCKTIWDVSRNTDRDEKRLELTDLCYYKGYFYCGWCEGEIHNSHPTGRARVVRSKDKENWETAVLLDWDAGDVRDPMITVTAEGYLMISSSICFVSREPRDIKPDSGVYLPPEALNQSNARQAFYQLDSPQTPESDSEAGGVRRQSVTWFSNDGINWSSCYACETGVNNWRWHVTWYNGMAYSVAYAGKDDNGTLYRSRDGKQWRALVENFFPGSGNEGCIAFDKSDTAYCLLRDGRLREKNKNPKAGGRGVPMLGIGKAPYYTDWEWKEVSFDWDNDGNISESEEILHSPIGGPKIITLNDGRIIAAGRLMGGEMDDGRICLFKVDPEKLVLTRFAELEGTTYAGIIEHEGKL